jgi:translation initiation factor 1
MADEPRFNNPFASLGSLKERLPAAPEPAVPVTPTPPAAATKTGRTYARAVVRMERSGRGGKEVTVVEQLDLTAAERDEWLKALKASLGCGGVIEGDNLVLQGDHRKRLPGILAARGVRKVVASN